MSATMAEPNPAPLSILRQGYLFAGGKYTMGEGGPVMSGQLYAEFQIPTTLSHPDPIVMVHGGGQSGTNFTGTPDGREGWAQFFLRRGYAVYVVDQGGKPWLRQVRVGRTVGDQVEILAGLEAGERVALDPLAAAR